MEGPRECASFVGFFISLSLLFWNKSLHSQALTKRELRVPRCRFFRVAWWSSTLMFVCLLPGTLLGCMEQAVSPFAWT